MPRFVDFFVREWQAERNNYCAVQYCTVRRGSVIRQVDLAEDVSFERGDVIPSLSVEEKWKRGDGLSK